MILAGDEMGHSQGGNNNAYAQDNETAWIDWARGDAGLTAFMARLVALRAGHPVLRQRHFLHARKRQGDNLADVIWRRADGQTPEPAQWHDPSFRCLGVELRMAAEGPPGRDAIFAIFNAGPAQVLTLPDTAAGWRLTLDTTRPEVAEQIAKSGMQVPANSVLVFTPDPAGGQI